MERRNYHSGLSVGPEHLNALEDYTDKRTEDLVASTIGWGVISGYGASMEGGFALGIAPGLAYDTSGRRLKLDGGLQINLAGLAPAVGLKTIKVGAIFAYDKSEPALDLSSNTVMTKWVETAALVKGDNLPADAILLYEVALSSAAITLITPAYRIFETPMSAIARTKGFSNTGSALTLEGSSAKFMRPGGFTLDLIEGSLRRTVFDPLHGPYKKGDILWLEPPTYDTQTTPPAGGGVAYPYKIIGFMGKEITYSAPTDFRQQAVRLRALVDNPRNPNIVGAIGSDWAVDDPSAIVEEGSNSNGSYVIYANFAVKQIMQRTSVLVSTTSEGGYCAYPIKFGEINSIAVCKIRSNTRTIAVQAGHTSETPLSLTEILFGTVCQVNVTVTTLVSAKAEGTI